MKLRSKGKKVKASLSGLFGRGQRSGGQFADGGIDLITSGLPNLVVQANMRPATETRRNMSMVGNVRNDALNDDTQSTTISTLHSDGPNIVGSKYEALDVHTNATGGILSNAHHLVLNNPTMVDKSAKIVVNYGTEDKASKAKKLLSKRIIPGAAHDSSARDPPPKCHPGTRMRLNERLIAWFYDETKQELILWIYGPAGVGKSAIVQTFAEALASANRLGASVFFSRPNGRNNSNSVFITIAYQIAVHIEPYCAFICELLAFDPELVNKSMEEQFKAFIVEPFVKRKIGAGGKKWGILLDGLDELDDRGRQQKIIRLITTFAHDHPEVPLAWVISSRPEPQISNTFKQQRIISSYQEECIPVDSPEACQDVERYLWSSFEIIQRVKFPHIIVEGWPEETKIVKLAHAASGLFAFADVVVRFIEDPNHVDPITRLDDVLSVIDGSKVGSADDQPFAHLDALYTSILTRIPSRIWPTTQRVLGAIPVSDTLGSLNCAKGLSVALGLELSKMYTSINDLYSILNIPPLGFEYSMRFRFHHASFVDFLRDAARSKEFCISSENAKKDLHESTVQVWMDFKRQSAAGPSSYKHRWSKYASQFHSEATVSADRLGRFNEFLFIYMHESLWVLLQERWNGAQEEASQHDWDQFFDLLGQVDAATACYGISVGQYVFVGFWFDVWKEHQKELINRGIVCKTRLERLPLDHLELPKENPTDVKWISFSDDDSRPNFGLGKVSSPESFHNYLEYFQKCQPNLRVLICGPLGKRFAVFVPEITKDDFKEFPPFLDDCIFDEPGQIYGHYYCCFPCPDNL